MADNVYASLDDIKPGDVLGQDILVGTQVLLTNGTVLNEAQIARLRRLNLQAVALRSADTAPAVPQEQAFNAAEAAVVNALSFQGISSPEEPTWLADEYFTKPVPLGQISEQEKMFAQFKNMLRESAGLKPLLPPDVSQRFSRDLQSSFITAALRKQVDLQQISNLAAELTDTLRANSGGFISFTDVEQYGQFLAARTLMSGKVFYQVYAAESNGWLKDHLRGQFALACALTLLPHDMATADPASESEDQKDKRRRAFLKMIAWLKESGVIEAEVLEHLEHQYERVDGKGIPYGLSGEEVPFFSQGWAITNTYSHQLLSQPARPRRTPRQAGDHIVAQSGRAYSSRAVNQFLRTMGYYPSGSLVELNDKSVALVHEQNPFALLKPVVKPVLADQQLGEPIDLATRPDLFIQRPLMEH
ncbi:hypothetical protein IT575_00030 [bacterium]|nr:hypothetical protein [bacterium]